MAISIKDKVIKDMGTFGVLLVEINMILLIDVMLVLLVIFIVTAFLFIYVVCIDLPRVLIELIVKKLEVVAFVIDVVGDTFWNGERIDEAELKVRLGDVAKCEPQFELHLSVDCTMQY